MKTSIFLLFGAIALTVLSCTKSPGPEPDPDPEPEEYCDAYYADLASVSSDDSNFVSIEGGGIVTFKAEGGETVINVSCGTSWTATNDSPDWLESNYNNKAGTLTLKVGRSIVEEEIAGTVTIQTATDKIKFATITVLQDAYGAPEITMETDSWSVPAVGGLSTVIGVEATSDWEVINTSDWLTAENVDGSLSLTAAENETAERRKTAVILSCTDGIKTSSVLFNVTQDARAYLTVSESLMSFDSEGGNAVVTVSSNYSWSCTASDTWFSASGSGETMTFNVSENGSTDRRQGTVTVTAGDGAENTAEIQITVLQLGDSKSNLILTYTLTEAATVALPVRGYDSYEISCTVDWGDGSDPETVTSPNPIHEYADAGSYDVSVNGSVPALDNYDGVTSGSLLSGVKQWGDVGLKNMCCALYGSSVASLPDPGSAFDEVVSFKQAFYSCRVLAEIPAGLFSGCSKATDMNSAFHSCSKLTTIPSGLFDGCTAVTDFESVFRSSGITSLPDGLFAKCSAATTFSYAFGLCSSLTEVGSGLFAGCFNVTDMSSVFYWCTGLTTVPSGLFDDCTSVTTFEEAFRVAGVIMLPSGLFTKCVNAVNFHNTFYGSHLVAVPDRLFAGCVSAEDFSQTFYKCSSLTEVGANVFKDCVNAKNFSQTFSTCTELTTISESIFSGCVGAENFNMTFYKTGLTSIPTALFADCAAATDFGSVFSYSQSLESVPENLFAGCKNAVTFERAFYYCNGLKEVRSGVFAGLGSGISFSEIFGFCEALETIPEGLFEGCSSATTFYRAFYYCSKLTSAPARIFSGCGSVTTFEDAFRLCESLTSVDATVFEGCSGVISFKTTFGSCASLTTVPEELFSDSPNVETFSYVFYSCSTLSNVPSGLFTNQKKVTDFSYAFRSCPSLTGESLYDTYEIDGETVKVHLYERMDDGYKSYYPDVTSINGYMCYNQCINLDDYGKIPSNWR